MSRAYSNALTSLLLGGYAIATGHVLLMVLSGATLLLSTYATYR